MVDVVQRQLQEADRLETVAGQLAIALAKRVVAAGTTASSMAALSKELRVLMAEALAGTKTREPDYLDELQARRQAKIAGA